MNGKRDNRIEMIQKKFIGCLQILAPKIFF